jgi:beta-N-acetylhexosaminidase
VDDEAAPATPAPTRVAESLAYWSELSSTPTPHVPDSGPVEPPVPTPPAAQQAREPRDRAWGPSGKNWQRAGELVAQMPLEQRAGHVIVGTYGGLEPPIDLVRDLGLAGVVLMGDNVASGSDSMATLAQTTRRLQSALDRPYPLIISVDQEGGPVARVGSPATPFAPGMAHGAADDADVSRVASRALGRELNALGFTMNFAPVADVTAGPSDPTIGVRSPGDRPQLVGRAASAQAAGLAEAGLVPVVKHFPGHGSVPADSHVELPVQTASLDRLTARDLVPFARAVTAGVPAVMVAHLDVRDVDPGVPSSLSAPVVRGLLRGDLGFRGVVVTDSLSMAAVTQRYSPADSGVAALRAGSDLLLMPPDARAARDGIVAAVRSGELRAQRLGTAVRRVVALQLHQADLLAQAGTVELSYVGSAAPMKASGRLSAAAVTLVSGRCEGPLVGPAVRVVGGTETDRALFTAAADRAGLATGSGDVVVLAGSPGSVGSGDVVVALDTPYGLGRSSASAAMLALFGRTPQAFDALMGVLTGRSPASGTLPVQIDGVRPPSC